MALLSLESFGLRREQGRLVPTGGNQMSDDATLIYVDADGNEVPEGDPRAVKQYRSDDEARPTVKTKTSKSKAAADAAADDEPETDDGAEAKAKTTPPEDKAVKAPKATKARTAPAESK